MLKIKFPHIFSIFCFVSFFNSYSYSQDIEKMNKSELRLYVSSLEFKIDTLFLLVSSLKGKEEQLSKTVSNSISMNSKLSNEISQLKALLAEVKNDNFKIQKEKDSVVSILNEEIILLKDSLKKASNDSDLKLVKIDFPEIWIRKYLSKECEEFGENNSLGFYRGDNNNIYLNGDHWFSDLISLEFDYLKKIYVFNYGNMVYGDEIIEEGLHKIILKEEDGYFFWLDEVTLEVLDPNNKLLFCPISN
jgi:hypothetical protein